MKTGMNKKKINGMFKDKCAGSSMTEFVGLLPKMMPLRLTKVNQKGLNDEKEHSEIRTHLHRLPDMPTDLIG